MKLGTALGSALLHVALMFATEAGAQEPPNVVILFADDLGYADLASYGNPYIRTPSLDRLAADGLRFTDFYVTAPVCSPSRGSLLTGQLPVRSGLYGRQIAVMFPGDPHGIPESNLTLAEGLKSAGYATGIFGKWHLGDAPEQYPTRHGFDYWYGVPYSNDMNATGRYSIDEMYRLIAAGEGAKVGENFNAAVVPKFNAPRSEDFDVPLYRSEAVAGSYRDELLERPLQQPTFTRRLTEEAVRFIEANRTRRFFVYLPYTMPHLPIFASDAFAGKSLAGAYGDTVEEIDWSVGRIRETLEALDLAENTLVVFTSDNGPWQAVSTRFAGSTGMLRGSKGTVYEGGMRVPAIFWWPGRIAPAVTSEIGSTLDVFATVLALAGVEPPADIDGFDLRDTLLRGAASPRTEMAYYRQGVLRAYRKGSRKVHFYASEASTEPLETPELYDLHGDVSEKENVAEAQPEALADVLSAVARHRASTPVAEPIFDQRFRGVSAASRDGN